MPSSASPVRYAKFESIRYFIDIDILQNCLIDIDIDIFQNHQIDIDIFEIAISISIFSTFPYRYRFFSKVSIYRQSICHIDISNRAKCHSKYPLWLSAAPLPKQISFRCLGQQWPFQTFNHKYLASLSDIIFHSFSAVSHHNIQPRPLSDHHETGHYNM